MCIFFSLLSHSAVVARELGLPTVVGVSGGLMKRLKVGIYWKFQSTSCYINAAVLIKCFAPRLE